MSTAMLLLAVCIRDVENKVGTSGKIIKYVSEPTFFLLFIAKERGNMATF